MCCERAVMDDVVMDRTVTVSQARATLAEIVQQVAEGDDVIITRYGQPVAVVVRPDAPNGGRAEGALARAAAVHELLVTGRSRRLEDMRPLSQAWADSMIDEVRTGRTRGWGHPPT